MTFRWPWQRRRRIEPSGADAAIADSNQALLAAQRRLNEAKQRGPEVTKVSKSLRKTREENHFTNALRTTFDRRTA